MRVLPDGSKKTRWPGFEGDPGHYSSKIMSLSTYPETLDATVAEMFDKELGTAEVPIALAREEAGFYPAVEVIERSKRSSLRRAVQRSWLKAPGHHMQHGAAARLFRRHVSRDLHP